VTCPMIENVCVPSPCARRCHVVQCPVSRPERMTADRMFCSRAHCLSTDENSASYTVNRLSLTPGNDCGLAFWRCASRGRRTTALIRPSPLESPPNDAGPPVHCGSTASSSRRTRPNWSLPSFGGLADGHRERLV